MDDFINRLLESEFVKNLVAFVKSLIQAAPQSVAEALLGAILTGLLTLVAAITARNLVRRGKVWVGPHAGHTQMTPLMLLGGLLVAVMGVVFLFWGFVRPPRDPYDFNVWVGGLAFFSLLSLPCFLLSRLTWEWDRAGLRWHGAFRTISMPWHEIVRLGKSWDARFFAAGKTGSRIYWSTYTLEHEALVRAIHAARPDLILPAGVNVSKYFDANTCATNAGCLNLSMTKFRAFKREICGLNPIDWLILSPAHHVERLKEHLWFADANPAIVMTTAPKLLVAAYSVDIDAVAILRFDERLLKQHRLQPGTRLITINSYFRPHGAARDVAKDLTAGPNYSAWANFHPVIADFVSNDGTRIEELKRNVRSDLWSRTEEMGRKYITRFPGRCRNGNPLLSRIPA